MATIEIESSKGMRWVRVDLINDDVRTERVPSTPCRAAFQWTCPSRHSAASWSRSFRRKRRCGPGTTAPALWISNPPSAATAR